MAETDTNRTANAPQPGSTSLRSPQRTRVRRCVCLLAAISLSTTPACHAAYRQQQAPAPIERRQPEPHVSGAPNGQPGASISGANQSRGFRGPRGEHLADWMSQHSNLPLPQQQQALDREPGFHDLPPETQQRYRNRLAQLDAMNPQRRQRILERNEAMERLSPDQRSQVRGALGQLGSLPPDQRRGVAQTFRALRDLPPDQRLAALNSGRFGPPLNGLQRGVLTNLLTVEPILPPSSRPQPLSPGQPALEPYPR